MLCCVKLPLRLLRLLRLNIAAEDSIKGCVLHEWWREVKLTVRKPYVVTCHKRSRSVVTSLAMGAYTPPCASRNLKVIRYYCDRTTVNGFANLSGLWSFSVVCSPQTKYSVWLFSHSSSFRYALLQLPSSSSKKLTKNIICVGVKQPSVFELVHKTGMRGIREECLAQYPRLRYDLRALPDRSFR